MKAIITQAILDHRLLQLDYQNQPRIVLPQVLGPAGEGLETLLCRQIWPFRRASTHTQYLPLDRISNVRPLDFRVPLPTETSTGGGDVRT